MDLSSLVPRLLGVGVSLVYRVLFMEQILYIERIGSTLTVSVVVEGCLAVQERFLEQDD